MTTNSNAMKPATGKIQRARDPVCGMELDPTNAARTEVFRGTTYYFDTVECAMKFGNTPDAFVNPPEVH